MSVASGYGNIKGFVFEDLEGDGLQGSKDHGLGAVKVQLIDWATHKVIRTTTTNFAGEYHFENVVAGYQYKVKFTNPKPQQYMFTNRYVGNDRTIDSDGPLSAKFTVKAGKTITDIDAGLFKKAKIGDFIFHDMDGDGRQDPGEEGISGVKIHLLDGSGKSIKQTVSNGNGEYHFSDLRPGEYQMKFQTKDGYHFSPRQVGVNPAIDSDGPVSDLIHLKSGDWNHKIDVGLYRPAKVGDFVWEDLDGDGIQDANEPGVEDVTVKLTRPNGNVVATTVTDGDGFYLFDKVRPGRYRVMFNNPDENKFKFTTPDAGSNDSIDSDADPITGQTPTFRLKSGDYNLTIDAGLMHKERPKAMLGDFVWEDLNANGIQDANELDNGINGVTVKLLADADADGQIDDVVETTITENNPNNGLAGYYKFNDLTPGVEYKVMFNNPDPVGPDAYMFSPRQADGNAVSGTNSDGPMSDVVILEAGEFNKTIDAGLFRKGSIHAFGFLDQDGDGIQDINEGAFPDNPGKTFQLLNENGEVLMTETTQDGRVWFEQLTPGNYTLRENPIPDGFELTTTPNERIFTIQSGQELVYEDGAAMLPNGDQRTEVKLGDVLRWGNTPSIQPAIDIEKLVRVSPQRDSGQDVCDTVGKPQTLLLQYIPGTEFNTQQSSKKGEGLVNNGLDDDGTSYVVISDKENGGGEIFFAGNISIGDTFEASSSKFSSNTFFSIFDDQGGPLLQSARYHTSCSAPIVLGDQIYSLTLLGLEGKDGSAFLPTQTDFVDADTAPGPEARVNSRVEFQYVVTNTGDTPLGNILVTDDRLSDLTFEGGDENNNNLLDLNETWLYSASEQATGEGLKTNKGSVTGSANGITVMDMDPANYTVVRQPVPTGDVCDVLGKPRGLTFDYNPGTDVITGQDPKKALAGGTPDNDGESYIVVSKKDKLKDVFKGKDTFFAGTVLEGDSFTVSAEKFGSQTNIFIFDDLNAFNAGSNPLQSIEYHTSCSQPIQLGDVIGSVELTGYVGEKSSAFV